MPIGAVIEKNAGSKGLELIDVSPLPSIIEQEERNLQREFEYLSGISELAVISATPAGVTSGKALEAIKETDDARLSLTAENIRNAVIQLSRQWLRLYKQFSFAPRILNYAGSNDIANVIVWGCNRYNKL